MTEQEVLDALDAVSNFATSNLPSEEQVILLHIFKKLLDAGLAAAMSVTLTADTGELIREDTR